MKYKHLTNITSVVCCTEDEFRCSVVPRANVRNIWFTLHQNFCTAGTCKWREGGVKRESGRVRKRVRSREKGEQRGWYRKRGKEKKDRDTERECLQGKQTVILIKAHHKQYSMMRACNVITDHRQSHTSYIKVCTCMYDMILGTYTTCRHAVLFMQVHCRHLIHVHTDAWSIQCIYIHVHIIYSNCARTHYRARRQMLQLITCT